jgi:hypothetical protein
VAAIFGAVCIIYTAEANVCSTAGRDSDWPDGTPKHVGWYTGLSPRTENPANCIPQCKVSSAPHAPQCEVLLRPACPAHQTGRLLTRERRRPQAACVALYTEGPMLATAYASPAPPNHSRSIGPHVRVS